MVLSVNGNKTTSVRVRGLDTIPEFLLDHAAPYSVLEEDLRVYLKRVGGYFSGHEVRVNLGSRLLNKAEAQGVCRILEEHQIPIAELWSTVEPVEKMMSESLSAPVVLGTRPRKQPPVMTPGDSDTLWVSHPCRTGTAIRHPGTVIVLGNVNPGAEVVASGDVVVVGTLRGVVHAGANGDPGAVIVAFSLEAAQMRIASLTRVEPSTGPQRVRRRWPEVAYISGESIKVEPYKGELPKETRSPRSIGTKEVRG